jgi:RNA polymerase sigma-70 factor (ECF subfamily)
VDREEFDRVMVEHLPAAGRFAVRLTGNPADAEDLLHDAIVRAARAWHTYAARARFTTWLYRIIINAWRDRHAASRRTDALEDAQGDWIDARSRDPASAAASSEICDLIAAKISSLPPRQREVIVLVAYEHLSTAEAADVLGVSEGNVRVNLFHARQRLKSELGAYLKQDVREKR